MEWKSSSAALLMEKFELSLVHRNSKRGKVSLKVDDGIKSPPSLWIWSLEQAGQVKNAMMVKFGCWSTLKLTEGDGDGDSPSCWLIIAANECFRIPELTTIFANSNPLLNVGGEPMTNLKLWNWGFVVVITHC